MNNNYKWNLIWLSLNVCFNITGEHSTADENDMTYTYVHVLDEPLVDDDYI